MLRRLLLTLALLCAAGLLAQTASAATTVTVTSTGDDAGSASAAHCPSTSGCTLRDALLAAAADGPGTEIDLPSQKITLTDQVTVTSPVNIVGKAGNGTPASVIYQQSILARVIDIDLTSNGAVSISNTEIWGGSEKGADGGGILAEGTSDTSLTLTDDLLYNNQSTGTAGDPTVYGGGIAMEATGVGSSLDVKSSILSQNAVTGYTGANGTTPGAGGSAAGGGIFATSTVSTTIEDDSTITNDLAQGGGGGGSTHAGTVGQPGASAYGGGIAGDGPVDIEHSTLTENTAKGGSGGSAASTSDTDAEGGQSTGGGVGMSNVPITLNDSTLSDNHAKAGANGTGGAAITYSSPAAGGGLETLGGGTITATTFTQNTAESFGSTGAAIAPSGNQTLAITNSTITANSSLGLGGQGGAFIGTYGGGIYGLNSTVTLTADTVDANSAGYDANLDTSGSAASIRVASSAIGDPSNGTTSCGGNVADASSGAGNGNFEDDSAATCGFAAARGDIVGGSAALGSLAANGAGAEAPQTLLPAAGSPLIGAGGTCGVAVDERGFTRPSGFPCDIGALQIQKPATTAAPSISPSTPVIGDQLTCAPGTWSAGDGGTLTYTYAWKEGGATIATGATYTTVTGDVGQAISCTVTASGAYGAGAPASSATVTPSAPAPVQTTTTTATTPPTTAETGTTPSGSSTSPGSTTTSTTTVSTSATVAPRLADVGETNHSWREARSKGRAKVGTTFTAKLSAAGTVTLSFSRLTTGHTLHGRCVAGRAAKGAKGTKSCTLSKRVGHLTLKGKAGSNRWAFSGKLGRTYLAVGSYRASLTLKAGSASSQAVTITFTIVS